MNLLPFIIRTDNNGLPFGTTYFDTEMCARGLYYLVHNICSKTGRNVHKTNFEIILSQIEKSLE